MVRHKKMIAFILALLVLSTTNIIPVYASYFSDVSSLTSEEYDAIMYVSDNGIMVGNGNGTFTPNSNVTRAEFVQTLYRLSGEGSYSYAIPFTDVSSSAWYYKAVCWAYGNDIVNGTSTTTFSPNATITVEQAITILYGYAVNYLDLSLSFPSGAINSHSDYSNISAYAREAMNWALGYRMIKPSSSTSPLTPKAYVQRKTVALYICRFEREVVGYTSEKYFSFTNSSGNFFNDSEVENYTITNTALNRMAANISAYYGTGATANEYLLLVQEKMNSPWKGACNGMSFVVLFDSLGKIDFNGNLVNPTSNIAGIANPKTSNDIRSGIHFYQLACYIYQNYRETYPRDSGTLAAGLGRMYESVKKSGPTVFQYFWHDSEGNTNGHSVVVIDMTALSSGSYQLKIYDPATGGIDTNTARVTSSGNVFLKEHDLTTIGYFTENQLNTIDFIDLDGNFNSTSISLTGIESDSEMDQQSTVVPDSRTGKVSIHLPCQNFVLTSSTGQTIAYQNGEVSGTMTIHDRTLILTGDEKPVDLMLVVDPADWFECVFEENDEDNYLICSSDLYGGSVRGTGIDSVRISSDGLTAYGAQMDVTIIAMTGVEEYEFVQFQGTAQDTIQMMIADNQISIDGLNDKYAVKFTDRLLNSSNIIAGFVQDSVITVDLHNDSDTSTSEINTTLNSEGTFSLNDFEYEERVN